MPSSWTQNYYHAVFSTKSRVASITPDLEIRLYPFMVGILQDLGCQPILINGTADHVHILTRFPADLATADMLRHVKQRSSKWVHDTYPDLAKFAWQTSYGGFTVSRSAVDSVTTYIRHQKTHHAEASFTSLAEFLQLLRKHDIEFDPKYIE